MRDKKEEDTLLLFVLRLPLLLLLLSGSAKRLKARDMRERKRDKRARVRGADQLHR
jgi:hypothetical protein